MENTQNRPPLPPRHRIIQISAASSTDPRTVVKFLRGEHVRGAAADRIAAALAAQEKAVRS
jgi:hypothetical protein